MPTGDHDLEYRKFEGVIEQGGYGAGPVMIWDEGSYVPEVEISKGVRRQILLRDEADGVMQKSLRDGILKFTLEGTKLRGSFALVRTGGIQGKEGWLLIKHLDPDCKEGYDANDYDFSASTGRSLAQIAGEETLPPG